MAPAGIKQPSSVSALTETPSFLVERSFATKSSYQVATGTRILLIPHHLVAAREIASLLSSSATPTRVILLSPDHFSRGKTAFSFSEQAFSWQGRIVPTDRALQSNLEILLGSEAGASEAVFAKEHGVRGLLPFLTTAWPNARITSLTVRNDTSKTSLQKLVQVLDMTLSDPGTLIVFTIDFSHDLPEYVADLHDLLAEDALRSLDTEAATDVEIDSRPLFWTVATLAATHQHGPLGNVAIHAHTNALSLMKAETTELGTSHYIASFSAGSKKTRSRSFALIHDEHRRVTSKENRFYRGFDAVTTSSIPFPAAFVKIDDATGTEWRVLPLKQDREEWAALNDRERTALSKKTVGRWIDWAKTHLTSDR